MATPAGQFRPVRLIMTFVVITAALYSLVFFTSGSNTPKLGIDLQGGTRITLQATTLDGSEPSRASMNQARDIMESRVNGSGVAGGQVQIDGSKTLVVTVPGTEDLADLARSAMLNFRPVVGTPGYQKDINDLIAQQPELVPTDAPSTVGTDAASTDAPGTDAPSTDAAGTDVVQVPTTAPAASLGEPSAATDAPATEVPQGLRAAGLIFTEVESGATEAPVSDAEVSDAAVTDAASTDAAVTDAPSTDAASTDAPSTDVAGTDVAGTDAPSTDAPVVVPWPEGSGTENPSQPASSDPAVMSAWLASAQSVAGMISCNDLLPYRGLDDPALPLLACDQQQAFMYVLDSTIIAGAEIDTASSGLSTSGGGWTVNVTFKSGGFNTWSTYTASHVGSLVGFTLDGEVVSAPSINGAITTVSTEITGSFTQESASALANSLKFGALPLAFERSTSESVSAELGLEYLTAGLIAGGIGLLLVVIYCLIYYRLLGVITILSLLLSFALVYAVLVLLGRWIGLSLDMSGVAGLIVAIGITADSFVIYFERLKDEVREGRTFRSAVPRGWQQAKRTILSADAVTFLASAVLYVLAVGEVKGFAFTLGLSTVLDLVVVFLVTHPLVAMASGNKVFASTRWSGLGAVAAAGAERRASQARIVPKEA